MKRKNRLTAIVLALVLVLGTALSGCGQKPVAENTEKAEEQSDVKDIEDTAQAEDAGEAVESDAGESQSSAYLTTYGDKQFDNVTITVEIFDRSNAPEGSTVTDNKWTEYVNQEMNKVGITVEFVPVPRSEETTKVQTMMATGASPDIVFSYGDLYKQYYNDGGTYNLSEYVDGSDQARNLKEYVTDQVLDYGRNEKGELCAITARRSSCAMQNFFIRKDWLDELGLSIPTTTDELYTVLKAFKENYPDCVPYFSDWFQHSNLGAALSHSFLESVADEKSYNINSWNFIYQDDGAAEYLRFMNKLYNEKLIDPEYYTISDVKSEAERLMVNGQGGVFELGVNYNVDTVRGSLLQTLKKSEPDAEYVSIAPFKNNLDGQIYNPAYSLNGFYMFIPKTAKNVDACITYLDWLATIEGGFTLYHGFEGEHFEYEDGIPVVKDIEYNASDKDWINNDLFLVGNAGYYKTENEFNLATAQGYGEWKDYVIDNYSNATTGILRYTSVYSSEKQAEYATELGLVNDEYMVKSVTCSPEEFDGIIEEWRAALKEAGADEVIEEYTNYYNSFE